MPKAKITTYPTLKFEDPTGKVVEAPITSIFSEEQQVAETSKEVSVFEKYTTKKPLNGIVNDKPSFTINECGEIIR